MEVQRICNIAPITAAHRAKSDTKVSGYIIPKVMKRCYFFLLYSLSPDFSCFYKKDLTKTC